MAVSQKRSFGESFTIRIFTFLAAIVMIALSVIDIPINMFIAVWYLITGIKLDTSLFQETVFQKLEKSKYIDFT